MESGAKMTIVEFYDSDPIENAVSLLLEGAVHFLVNEDVLFFQLFPGENGGKLLGRDGRVGFQQAAGCSQTADQFLRFSDLPAPPAFPCLSFYNKTLWHH